MHRSQGIPVLLIPLALGPSEGRMTRVTVESRHSHCRKCQSGKHLDSEVAHTVGCPQITTAIAISGTWGYGRSGVIACRFTHVTSIY